MVGWGARLEVEEDVKEKYIVEGWGGDVKREGRSEPSILD